MRKQVLIDKFKDVTLAAFWCPLVPQQSGVGIDDVELFIEKYAVFRGDKDCFHDFLADKVIDEFNRRMGFFTCETDGAKAFLKEAILCYLISESETFYKEGSLWQSMYDILYNDYFYVEVEGEYLAFDFEKAPFDYEQFLTRYQLSLDDMKKVGELAKKEISSI